MVKKIEDPAERRDYLNELQYIILFEEQVSKLEPYNLKNVIYKIRK